MCKLVSNGIKLNEVLHNLAGNLYRKDFKKDMVKVKKD